MASTITETASNLESLYDKALKLAQATTSAAQRLHSFEEITILSGKVRLNRVVRDLTA
jgi:hypothetical protein